MIVGEPLNLTAEVNSLRKYARSSQALDDVRIAFLQCQFSELFVYVFLFFFYLRYIYIYIYIWPCWYTYVINTSEPHACMHAVSHMLIPRRTLAQHARSSQTGWRSVYVSSRRPWITSTPVPNPFLCAPPPSQLITQLINQSFFALSYRFFAFSRARACSSYISLLFPYLYLLYFPLHDR